MSDKDGGPAFPAHDYIVGDLQRDQFQKLGETRGMTLRDYFAAKAIPPLVQSAVDADLEEGERPRAAAAIALQAYALADAMLKERARER